MLSSCVILSSLCDWQVDSPMWDLIFTFVLMTTFIPYIYSGLDKYGLIEQAFAGRKKKKKSKSN